MYKRARYYDPGTGEFISRDPLEYVDGMSQYRGYFVPGTVDPWGLFLRIQDKYWSPSGNMPLSPPSKNVDFEMPKRKARVRAKLNSFRTSIGKCLLDATGAGDYLTKLEGLVDQVDVFDVPAGEAASYSWAFDTVWINKSHGPSTYLHEFTHIYDDFQGYYLGFSGIVEAENLAYGAQEFFDRLEKLQRRIAMIRRGHFNCELEFAGLEGITNSFGKGGYKVKWRRGLIPTVFLGAVGEKIASDSDMKDVVDKLGLDADCEKIKACIPKLPCDCEIQCHEK